MLWGKDKQGMSGNITIRPAGSGDMAAIAEIYRPSVEAGTASFEFEAPDAAEMERRRAGIAAAGYPYLVAEVEGRVAGFAYVGSFRARPAFMATVENSVYVAAEMQGRGVGRALLMALIEAATRAGFRQMIAVIGDSQRQAASIRLHGRCGFAEVGRMPAVGFKNDEWLDIVFMQRALGAGDDGALV